MPGKPTISDAAARSSRTVDEVAPPDPSGLSPAVNRE
jgi:hypothetical protein